MLTMLFNQHSVRKAFESFQVTDGVDEDAMLKAMDEMEAKAAGVGVTEEELRNFVEQYADQSSVEDAMAAAWSIYD